MSENLLAIDNGTQSVRALLFDPRGNLLNKSRVQIEPYYSTAPGLAEQDPEVFWKAICEACQGLWSQGVDKSSIAAVALTTQRSTLINLDKNGNPLCPAIHRLDQLFYWLAPPRRWPIFKPRLKQTGFAQINRRSGRQPTNIYIFRAT